MAGAVVPNVGMLTKHTGTPASAKHECRLQAVTVLHERRHRPDEIAHQRPAARDPGAAGHRARHLHRAPRLTFALDEGLQVFPASESPASSLCGRPSPPSSPAATVGHQKDRPGQRVHKTCHGSHIGLRGRAAAGALQIDDLRAAAVGGAERVARRQVEVAGRVASAEHEVPGARDIASSTSPGGKRTTRLAVFHVGAVLFEERKAHAASRSARRRARGSAGSPASNVRAPRRRAAADARRCGWAGWLGAGGCHDLLLESGPVCQTIRRPASTGKRSAGRLRHILSFRRSAGRRGAPLDVTAKRRRTSTRVAIVTLSPVRLVPHDRPCYATGLATTSPTRRRCAPPSSRPRSTQTPVRVVRDARPHRSGTPAGAAHVPAPAGLPTPAWLWDGDAASLRTAATQVLRRLVFPVTHSQASFCLAFPFSSDPSPPGRWAGRTRRPSIWKT